MWEQVLEMDVCWNEYLRWKYPGTSTRDENMSEQAEQLSPKSSWTPFGRYPSMISFNWSSNGFVELSHSQLFADLSHSQSFVELSH